MKTLYEQIKSEWLNELAVTLYMTKGQTEQIADYTEEKTEQGVRLTCSIEQVAALQLDAVFVDHAVVFSVDATLPHSNWTHKIFTPEKAVRFRLGPAKCDRLLANAHDNPYWMMPRFGCDLTSLPPLTQSFLMEKDGRHYHFLLLCGENFRCEAEGDSLYLTSDMSGLRRLQGAFLVVSEADDPFTAVERSHAAARETGALRVPLRCERQFPEMLDGFGFCTWDAFYRDVTSEKIYAKLEEFREKKIPVRWMIIDDGWMSTDGDSLSDFAEDRVKFPEGLKACIRRIKEDYGVEKVGVWHAFNGYWIGVTPGSKLWQQQRENLMETPGGMWLTALDEEKAFAFWDTWHSYLADCGVDFLKVDNQSANSEHLVGALPTVQGCRIFHKAIERSICKHFGGVVIDCMGMDMENVQSRPFSAVSRNSDDFYPRKPHSFSKHLVQNVYSALWHGQIHYCDFDMWWSEHESAVQSGVLRAISGAPIYVSDELGHSCAKAIRPTVEDDGTLMRCDAPALPTLDCLYTDCAAENRLQKIWNRSGDCFAVAAFNLGDTDITDTILLSGIPGLSGSYMAYSYFSHTWLRVNADSLITLTLPAAGTDVWNLYPIVGEGDEAYILAGNPEKYVPIASQHKTRLFVKNLL